MRHRKQSFSLDSITGNDSFDFYNYNPESCPSLLTVHSSEKNDLGISLSCLNIMPPAFPVTL